MSIHTNDMVFDSNHRQAVNGLHSDKFGINNYRSSLSRYKKNSSNTVSQSSREEYSPGRFDNALKNAGISNILQTNL